MNRRNLCILLLSASLWTHVDALAASSELARNNESAGYIANKDSLRSFFDAISSRLNKPIIVSKLAARKQVSGEFGLGDPQALLARVSQQLGLIWYHDGQAIYVYDASESRNAVVSLNNASLNSFNNFLRKSGLYDRRYPLRALDSNRVFYVSGPPVFVDLVVNAAAMLDKHSNNVSLGKQRIGVIRLNNTFVSDRSYVMRDQKMVVPGIGTVIERLLEGESEPLQQVKGDAPAMPALSSDNGQPYQAGLTLPEALKQDAAAGNIKVMAYPDTNSLLVKGTADQVRFIENLVTELDVAKRHVELSLWIIDMNKQDLDQMGVSWSGQITLGDSLGASINQNGSVSTLDGNRFIASVMALAQKDRANVVSRPVVLTQENVPALFDNSRTFYARLVGERNASLEHVTYGTMVSVLPRFSSNDEIEMMLNIEDGHAIDTSNNSDSTQDTLPLVARTLISTVARVPQGKSLLLGGYTIDSNEKKIGKIPLLGDLPLVGGLFRYNVDSQTNNARVFLIQPREINSPLERDAGGLVSSIASEHGLSPEPTQEQLRNILESNGKTPTISSLPGYTQPDSRSGNTSRGD
ncbi:MAG: type III secretion system outer membrane ring subunit SctC [Plesiomonas sp.]|uniref:type III secretion system outer membrane ring subunit SctC n=1 Tax=Plesiomonas sp. TaxID=2486279 RepID=UPI003F413F3E